MLETIYTTLCLVERVVVDRKKSVGRYSVTFWRHNEAVRPLSVTIAIILGALQVASARQPHCDTLRSDPAQPAHRSQQLRRLHQSQSGPAAAVKVSVCHIPLVTSLIYVDCQLRSQ